MKERDTQPNRKRQRWLERKRDKEKDRYQPDPKTEADWSANTAVTGTGEPRISAHKIVVVIFYPALFDEHW